MKNKINNFGKYNNMYEWIKDIQVAKENGKEYVPVDELLEGWNYFMNKAEKDGVERYRELLLSKMNSLWKAYEINMSNIPKPNFMSAYALISALENTYENIDSKIPPTEETANEIYYDEDVEERIEEYRVDRKITYPLVTEKNKYINIIENKNIYHICFDTGMVLDVKESVFKTINIGDTVCLENSEARDKDGIIKKRIYRILNVVK